MELGAFSVSLAVKDPRRLPAVHESSASRARGRRIAELADPKTRPRHRSLPGHVREEHPHLQPGRTRTPARGDVTDVRDLQRELKASGVQFMSERMRARQGVRPASSPIQMAIPFSLTKHV